MSAAKPEASPHVELATYTEPNRDDVLRLWSDNFPGTSQSVKEADIAAGAGRFPELFVVAVAGGAVAGTCVAAFDGHRGWLYYVCTDLPLRRRGIATRLVREAERRLAALGCTRVGLQMRPMKRHLEGFYRKLGYAPEPVTCYGRKLGG